MEMEREPNFFFVPKKPEKKPDPEEEGRELLFEESGTVPEPLPKKSRIPQELVLESTGAHEETTPSLEEIKSKYPAWQDEAERLYFEQNIEDDEEVLSVDSRVRARLQEQGVVDMPGDEYEKQILGMYEEEYDRYVEQHPEEAQRYADDWERWAKLANLDPKLGDKEWEAWVREHREPFSIGTYRAIARAYWRSTGQL